MLEDILAVGDYESYRYRMAICHVPFTYVDKNGYYEDFRLAWTEMFNEMDIDVALSGHKHVLWAVLPGTVEPNATLTYQAAYSGREGKTDKGYITDANFPWFLVGRRSLYQEGSTQSYGYTQYVGLVTRVDFTQGRQISTYCNSEHEIIMGVYPFVGDHENSGFADIVTQLKRGE